MPSHWSRSFLEHPELKQDYMQTQGRKVLTMKNPVRKHEKSRLYPPCCSDPEDIKKPETVVLKLDYELKEKKYNYGIPYTAIREYTALQNFCNHPHIPNIYDIRQYITTNDDYMTEIVIEHGGIDLHSWVEIDYKTTSKTQINDMAQTICVQIASALHYMHAYGYIHRDVKPRNVVWNSDEKKSLLIDFNSSRCTPGITGKQFLITNKQTTFLYNPPESIKDTYYPESDVYSLGCTILYFLCGQEPLFDIQEDEKDVLNQHFCHEWNKMLQKRKQNIHPKMQHIIQRMISVNPQERPTVQQILQYWKEPTMEQGVYPRTTYHPSFYETRSMNEHEQKIYDWFMRHIRPFCHFINPTTVYIGTRAFQRVIYGETIRWEDEDKKMKIMFVLCVNLAYKFINRNAIYSFEEYINIFKEMWPDDGFDDKDNLMESFLFMEAYIFHRLNYCLLWTRLPHIPPPSSEKENDYNAWLYVRRLLMNESGQSTIKTS